MKQKKQPKRRIHQNVWGNWNGYEGNRRTEEFGLDWREAHRWVGTLKDYPSETDRRNAEAKP